MLKLCPLLVSCVVCCVSTVLSAQRPHIILIVADDLGYNDVSFHGSTQIPTPNLDGLAYSGVILNNYYVSPICTPTRSALMTGRHPIHTGMQHSVIVGAQPYGLPLEEKLLSQHLNDLGYQSHIVGKWHLGMHKWEYTPLYRGFKSHYGYYQGCEDYYDHTYEAFMAEWGLDFRRDKDLLWNMTGYYSTDLFKDEALKVIHTHNKTEPLFLYLPFQAVHSSNGHGPHLQAPKKYIDRFSYIENHDRRIYAGMVSALDDAVGEIYDSLKQSGMLENSVIVFTTDNGGPANGYDFNAANNFPLRGVKNTLWEGGVRGVGFVHSPLLEVKGYTNNEMLHVCDWLPTLYSVAGGNVTQLQNLDGYDAWNVLSRKAQPVRNEILHNIDPINNFAGIRHGDLKLLIGDVGVGHDDWYPPYQLEGDEQFYHVSNFSSMHTEPVSRQMYRKSLGEKYQSYWGTGVISRLKELQGSHIGSEQKDNGFPLSENVVSLRSSPVTVDCGPKPANASTNCDPRKWPCLFNITSDPCEYNNLADKNWDLVVKLLERINFYASSMVKPANRPFDDRGNPKYHNGAWVPWL